MQALLAFCDTVSRIIAVIGGIVITLMMVHISADVASRYIFNIPLPGTIAIVSSYYMVIAAFLPMAYVELRKENISVEIFFQRLRPSLQKHISGLTTLLTLLVFVILTWRAWEVALSRMQRGDATVEGSFVLPIWPGHFILFAGLLLTTLIVAVEMCRYLQSLISSARDI